MLPPTVPSRLPAVLPRERSDIGVSPGPRAHKNRSGSHKLVVLKFLSIHSALWRGNNAIDE
jgi:hypothetical protein